MKNKADIIVLAVAALGGVAGAWLWARGHFWGEPVLALCVIYIIVRLILLRHAVRQRRQAELAAAVQRRQEKMRLEHLERENKYKAAKQELTTRNGEPGKTIFIQDNYADEFDMDNELIVYDKTRRLWLCGHEIAIADINSFMIDDESTVLKGQVRAVTVTDSDSVFGRSIAGALIGGNAGAIIGGTTARKQTFFRQENDRVIHDYTLVVNVRDLQNPMLQVRIGNDKQKAMEINALMQVVMTMK